MSDSDPHDPTAFPIDPHDDGKLDASIVRCFPEYCFALDAYGQEYFIFHNAVEMMGRHCFDDLRIGSTVRLRPIAVKGRGFRGIEVEIVAV